MPFTVLVGSDYNVYYPGANDSVSPSNDPRKSIGRGIYKGENAMYFAPDAVQDGLTMKEVYDVVNDLSIFTIPGSTLSYYTNLKLSDSDANGSLGHMMIGQKVKLNSPKMENLRHNIRFFEWNAFTETSDAECDEEYIHKVLRDNIRRFFNNNDCFWTNFRESENDEAYIWVPSGDKTWSQLWIWAARGWNDNIKTWYSGYMSSKFVSGNGRLAWCTDMEADAVLNDRPGHELEYILLDGGTNIYGYDRAGNISQEYPHGSTRIILEAENTNLWANRDKGARWSIMPVLEKHNLYQCQGHTVPVQIKFNPDATGVTNPTSYTQDVDDTTTTVTLTANQFVRPGYKVVGWASVPSGTKRWDNGGTFSGQHTLGDGTPHVENYADGAYKSGSPIVFNLYAIWEPDYKITYDYNAGIPANTKSVLTQPDNPAFYSPDSPAITLKNPSRTGYDFLGWSGTGLSGNTNNPVVIPTGSSGDRSYTATWRAIQYPLTYSYSYGIASPTGSVLTDPGNPASYTIDTATFTLGNPSRTGYTFTGWSGTGLSGESNMSVQIPMGSTGARSYTSHWTPQTWGITYDYGNGIPADTSSVFSDPGNPGSYTFDTEVHLTNPSRTGYTFTGWSGTGLSGSSNMDVWIRRGDSGARSYQAHWRANNYTLYFQYNIPAGCTSTITGNTASKTVTFDSAIGTLPNPTLEGYTHGSWSIDSSGITESTKWVWTTDKTANIYWEANQYKLYFDFNDPRNSENALHTGSIVENIPQNAGYVQEGGRWYKMITYDKAIGALPSPTLIGYSFNGWTIGGSLVTADTLFNKGSIPGIAAMPVLTGAWEIQVVK